MIDALRNGGGGGAGGPVHLQFGNIIVQGAPGDSAADLWREFGREAGPLMRSHFSDGVLTAGPSIMALGPFSPSTLRERLLDRLGQ